MVDITNVEAEPILDAEPDLGSGVAGALHMAVSKGYLEKETVNRPNAARFTHLQAQNYSIEDKSHGYPFFISILLLLEFSPCN